MSDATEAVDLNHSLDVHRDFTAEVTFTGVRVFDFVTKLRNVFFSQILRTGIGIDTGLCEDVVCALAADTVNVGKGDLYALVVRNKQYGSYSWC